MSSLNFLIFVVIAHTINMELTAYGAALPSSTDSVDDLISSMDSQLKESHKGITWTLVRQILHSMPVTEADGTTAETTELSTETLLVETSSLLDLSVFNKFSENQLSDPDRVQPSEIETSQDLEQMTEDVFDMIPRDRIFSDEPHIQISIDSNSLANQVNISNLHNNSHLWDTYVEEMASDDDINRSIPVLTEFTKSHEFPNESQIPIESEHIENDAQSNEPDVLTDTDSVELESNFEVQTDAGDPELNKTLVDLTHDSKDQITSVHFLEQKDSAEESKDSEKTANESDVQGIIINLSSNSTVSIDSDKIDDSDIHTFTEVSSESEAPTGSAIYASSSDLLVNSMEVSTESEMQRNSAANDSETKESIFTEVSDSIVNKDSTDIDNSDVLTNDSEAEESFTVVANDSVESQDFSDPKLQVNVLNNSSNFDAQTNDVKDVNDLESAESSKVSNTDNAADLMTITNEPTISVDDYTIENNSSETTVSGIEVKENVPANTTFVSELFNKFQEEGVLRNTSTDSEHEVNKDFIETINVNKTSMMSIPELNKTVDISMNLTSVVSTSIQNSNVDHDSLINVDISSPFENKTDLKSEETVVVNNDVIFTPKVNVSSNEILVSEIGNDAENSLEPECPAPGFCILWFMAQDACSMNSDCQRPTICCRVGCAKACVEV